MFKLFKKKEEESKMQEKNEPKAKKSFRFVWKLLVVLALIAAPLTYSSVLHTSKTTSGKTFVTIDAVGAVSGADYTYTNPDADIAFALALSALPATGGTLDVLSTGTVQFASAITVTKPNVVINGSGTGTAFTAGGVNAPYIAGANGLTFENCKFDVAPNMGATTGWLWVNVAVGTTLYTERSPNSSLVDSTLAVPTGRAASFVIATSDAPATWKAQADYVCSTTDISPAISAGITALMVGNLGGIIQISPTQTATFGATITLPDVSGINGAEITINGSGMTATNIELTGSNDMFHTTGTYSVVTFSNMSLYGNNLAYSFFVGAAYQSNFQNLEIHAFGTAGIIETKSDASTCIQNCIFNQNGTIGTTNSASIVLGNGTSHVYIYNNQFGYDARSIQVAANSWAGNILIKGNVFGAGAANGFYIQSEYFTGLDIQNNQFEITPGTVTAISCPNLNAKNIYSLLIEGNNFIAETNLTVPIINLAGHPNFVDITINNNHFDVAAVTVPSIIDFSGSNQYWQGLYIENNTIRADGGTVTNGFIGITDGNNPRFYINCVIKNNYANTLVTNCNPIGLLATPWAASWTTVGLTGYSATVTASTNYVAIQDLIITAADSSNANNSITIKDAAGNVMASGLHTLTMQLLPAGYTINFGAFTGSAGVTSVYGQ